MNEWSANQVKEHLEKLLGEREVALTLLAKTTDEKLAHLNALRENVLTRHEYTIAHTFVTDRLAKIEAWQNKSIGVFSVFVFLGGLLGGTFGVVVNLIVNHLSKP